MKKRLEKFWNLTPDDIHGKVCNKIPSSSRKSYLRQAATASSLLMYTTSPCPGLISLVFFIAPTAPNNSLQDNKSILLRILLLIVFIKACRNLRQKINLGTQISFMKFEQK